MRVRRTPARLVAFVCDRRAASAVEFSIVAMPFIMLLLVLPQMALYFMTQSSLDAGVIRTGDVLVNSYYAAAAPTPMTPAALKTLLVSKSGGLIHDDNSGAMPPTTLSVELRELSALNAAVVPVGNTVDPSAPKDVLVLRAKATVPTFLPLIPTLSVQSAVIVRRQAL